MDDAPLYEVYVQFWTDSTVEEICFFYLDARSEVEHDEGVAGGVSDDVDVACGGGGMW